MDDKLRNWIAQWFTILGFHTQTNQKLRVQIFPPPARLITFESGHWSYFVPPRGAACVGGLGSSGWVRYHPGGGCRPAAGGFPAHWSSGCRSSGVTWGQRICGILGQPIWQSLGLFLLQLCGPHTGFVCRLPLSAHLAPVERVILR